jgi:hypothetical protein
LGDCHYHFAGFGLDGRGLVHYDRDIVLATADRVLWRFTAYRRIGFS